jgi:hypothetical protein
MDILAMLEEWVNETALNPQKFYAMLCAYALHDFSSCIL